MGASTWTLTHPEFNKLSVTYTLTPGMTTTHSSFRSELSGVVGILDYIHQISSEHNVVKGGMEIFCDNERVVDMINTWCIEKVQPNNNNSDMVSTCLKLREELAINVTGTHVRGHQDDNVQYHQLSKVAQCNVDMDRAAKEMATIAIVEQIQAPPRCDHPFALPKCQWREIPIVHKTSEILYYHIYQEKMASYWVSKERVQQSDAHLIDYDTIYRGSKAQSVTMRRFSSKWACETIGTGKNMKRWKLRYDGYCPYCKHPDETTDHILTCQHIDSVMGWEEELKTLLQFMHKIGTCMILIRATKNDLIAWRYKRNTPNIEHYPTMIRKILLQQRRLGWKRFLEGVMTTAWREYMGRHYKSQQSMKTGGQWASKMYGQGWKTLFKLWEIRNQQLHNTQRITDMEGTEQLKQAITNEYAKGLGRLPASDFSHLFKKKLPELLLKSTDVLKNWFLIIRQGRVLMDKDNLIEDEFQTNSALASWIGLSFQVTDAEGKEPLQEAILQELQQGIGGLPQRYSKYFQQTAEILLKQSLHQLRLWLTNIRKGRMRYNTDNLLQDEFTNPGAFRDWLGF